MRRQRSAQGSGVNVHNDLSRDINAGIRRARGPALSTIRKWREEWKKGSACIHYTFEEWKKKKIAQFYKEKRKKLKEQKNAPKKKTTP
jgi:hypothetical protein